MLESEESHVLFDLPAVAEVTAVESVYRQGDVTQRGTARGHAGQAAGGRRVEAPEPEEALFNGDIGLSSLSRLLLEGSFKSFLLCKLQRRTETGGRWSS